MPPDSIRSRSGCISCRRRKKKCDEVFNAAGVCGRCHHGSFECIREGKVIRKPPQTQTNPDGTAKSVASGGGMGGGATTAKKVKLNPTNSPPPSRPAPLPLPHAISVASSSSSSISVPPTPSSSSSSTPFSTALTLNGGNHPLSNQPRIQMALDQPHPRQIQQIQQPHSYTFPPPAPNPMLSQPIQHYSPPFHAPPPPPTTSGPSVLNQPPQPHQQLLPSHSQPLPIPLQHQDLSHNPLPDDISSFFTSLDSITMDHPSSTSPTAGLEARSLWDAFPGYALVNAWGQQQQSPEGQHEHRALGGRNEGSSVWDRHQGWGGERGAKKDVKHCEKPEHMEGLVKCDCKGPSPMYNNLNDDFYQSIPSPVREIVKSVTGDVAASHDLTRAASIAIVLLYRARVLDKSEEKREMLLKQSEKYFQAAVGCLETSNIPLEAQLIGVADMQLHQFDQAGASAAYAILLVGEYFITSSLGPRPSLDISTIGDHTHIGTWMFVWADCLRAVCLPHTRTVYNFVGLPGGGELNMLCGEGIDGPAIGKAYSTHLGLPMGLLLCFAAVSNLSVDIWEGVVGSEEGRKKAGDIEKAIREWYPYEKDQGMDSLSYLDTVATQEMWRQAALIYLYQAVYRVGSLATTIRTSVTQILQLGARKITPPTKTSNSMYAGSFRACPWFLAATCAVVPEDRELCRIGLRDCGPQKAYQDNLKAIERFWEITDEGGWPVDWKEVAEKEGMFIGFL